MIEVIAYLVAALAGASVVVLVQLVVSVRRAARTPPSKEQIEDLREAISKWADEYHRAKPTGRYAKRREAVLFAACTKVGLMWLSPKRSTSGGK